MSDQQGASLDRAVYWESLTLIERLHRQFLDLLKSDLERLGYSDINNVQSLILYNIGDDNLTVVKVSNGDVGFKVNKKTFAKVLDNYKGLVALVQAGVT